MEKRKPSSEQIEYSQETDTWVPKKGILTGKIDFGEDTPGSFDAWRGKPFMIVDGIELSWDEFAQTVLTHEGFQFKLEFIDPSDPIE